MTNPTSTLALDPEFAHHIVQGLQQTPKKLSSRYFYDDRGDKLFQQIMRMPEYYLTDAEYEILETHRAAIRARIGEQPFDLVELGAGDGYKTKVLLEHFLDAGLDFTYRPIDISSDVLDTLERDLVQTWPQLDVQPIPNEYFRALDVLDAASDRQKVLLFMGGNIGNFQPDAARDFLCHLHQHLHAGDLLLVGFDLKKDPQRILDAYNDPAGITAAFNLNLLRRINRELGGNFDLDQWSHWENYDPITGATRSFLVSRCAQEVHLEATGTSHSFRAWEAIDVELSQKLGLEEIEPLGADCGFTQVDAYFDRRRDMVNVLWRA